MAQALDNYIEGFRRGGLKVTPQRYLLCSLVASSNDHPTIETIYQRAVQKMPTLSLKTVYTTLTELAELGLIRLANLGTQALRVDSDPVPHAHLVCKTCGEVIDEPECESPSLPACARELGFEIEEREIIYRGRCAECRHR